MCTVAASSLVRIDGRGVLTDGRVGEQFAGLEERLDTSRNVVGDETTGSDGV